MSCPGSRATATLTHRRVIAIDGPAAAGKSTVANALAERMGALVFDTGALYRAIAYLALQRSIAVSDSSRLAALANEVDIDIRAPSTLDGRLYDVWVDGVDVTWNLRTPEVGAVVSEIAEQPQVREALMPVQRRIAAQGPVVMVGRDIGTVVVPDAGLKIYLDASPKERARRRHRESAARGSSRTLDEVMKETLHRDAIDTGRQVAPLKLAPDAVRINTDALDVEEVVAKIEALARAQRSSGGALIWPRPA